MNDQLSDVSAWVIKTGLAGASEPDLLGGFCRRCRDAGLPVARGLMLIDTLHPVHEGRLFRWLSDDADEVEVRDYGRTTEGELAESWQRSPFYSMLQSGTSMLRCRLATADTLAFPAFAEFKAAGQTDIVVLIQRFAPDSVIGEMDCIYSSWTTDDPDGFRDDQILALKALVPALALAVKAASLARIAEVLVQTYLGRDAGRQVLAGRIARGVAERIDAVIWFSDLRSFTRMADASPPDAIIPFLNDYAEAVISAVHEAGGDVLKLIGDGTLAIFTAPVTEDACRMALHAEKLARKRVQAVNARRAETGLPVTEVYLGLHVGEVFYGNIGSQERLDFTVVGPAVNEVSRIVAMCRSIERDVLFSSPFAEATPAEHKDRLVCVGRYALRGVGRAQELFTLDPAERAAAHG